MKIEAAGLVSRENLEEVEETAQPIDLASFQSKCTRGNVEWKYQSMTTNHYLCLPKSHSVVADVPNVAQQVRAMFNSYLFFHVWLARTFISLHSILLLLVADCHGFSDE